MGTPGGCAHSPERHLPLSHDDLLLVDVQVHGRTVRLSHAGTAEPRGVHRQSRWLTCFELLAATAGHDEPGSDIVGIVVDGRNKRARDVVPESYCAGVVPRMWCLISIAQLSSSREQRAVPVGRPSVPHSSV
jgi:hypothetical protein